MGRIGQLSDDGRWQRFPGEEASALRSIVRGPLAVLFLAVAAAPAVAQAAPDSAKVAEMAVRYATLASPGPEHERLAGLAGDWIVEAAFGASAQQMTARAEATNRMILGGRFLTTEVKGTVGGMPFESLTIVGYDRGPGQYTAVGYDTFGTFYVSAAGARDERQEAIVMKGSYNDTITGHAHDYEFVLAIESPDRFTWTVVFLEGGGRSVAAKLSYRRR